MRDTPLHLGLKKRTPHPLFQKKWMSVRMSDGHWHPLSGCGTHFRFDRRTPKRLVKNQVLGEFHPHPTLVVPTHVKFAEVLGLVNSDTEKTKPEPAMKTCAPKPGNPEEYTAKDDAENNSPNTVSKYSVDELDLSHVEEKYRNRLRELPRRFLQCGMDPLVKSLPLNIVSMQFPGANRYLSSPIGQAFGNESCLRRT